MEQPKNEQAAPLTKTGVENTTNSEQGRVKGGPQPVGNNEDISQVDQQEGEMNNGELGGNFDAGSTQDMDK